MAENFPDLMKTQQDKKKFFKTLGTSQIAEKPNLKEKITVQPEKSDMLSTGIQRYVGLLIRNSEAQKTAERRFKMLKGLKQPKTVNPNIQ